MYTNYRESHMSPSKGNAYEKMFQNNPHRSLIWELERKVLDEVVQRFLGDRPLELLDFACGAGRIIAYLEEKAHQAVGVDISPEMLSIAKKNVKKARLVEADLTRGDVLGEAQFNLITAFRFFPNAETELRREVISVLVEHLAPGGCLVFNNHKNMGSTLYRLSRLMGRGGNDGMSQSEVDELLKLAGLRLEEVYSVGLIPVTEKHMPIPKGVLRPIENTAMALGVLKDYGQDLIFVCSRS